MHIFISYAKADTYGLAINLRDELSKLDSITVWMDETLTPGRSWASQIQAEIRRSDVMVVLISPDVNRDPDGEKGISFVINEIEYAQSLRKLIIPVMAQKTDRPIQIVSLQYIDFTDDHSIGIKRLIREIARRAGISETAIPLTPPAGTITPTTVGTEQLPPPADSVREPIAPRRGNWIYALVLLPVISLVLLILYPNLSPGFVPTPTAPSVVGVASPTTLPLSSNTPSLSTEPTAQSSPFDANQAARATIDAARTATATLWTLTPSPTFTPTEDTPSTIEAQVTALVATDMTATQQTLLIFKGVQSNGDWTPQYQTFNGFEMAVVPVGCFMMGIIDGEGDENTVHQQCFDQPFWIDRYEVTNQQYGFEGNAKVDNRPVAGVTWFQARDFCVQRGARLPTEREWEYAARGPSNLVYPWGNDFVPDNVVYSGNANQQSADVGSRHKGDSWVGASDLSGNLWEWVSSRYQPYPYKTDDGRELDSDRTDVRHVLRGGSGLDYGLVGRVSDRFDVFPTYGAGSLGFRCARLY